MKNPVGWYVGSIKRHSQNPTKIKCDNQTDALTDQWTDRPTKAGCRVARHYKDTNKGSHLSSKNETSLIESVIATR